MKRVLIPLSLALLFCLSSPYGNAQQNTVTDNRPVISYQGLLTSPQNGQPLSGTHRITVTLYGDDHGTQRVWEGSYQTELSNGVFNLHLGSGAYPLPVAKELDRPMWLGVRVDENEEMKPLTRLTSTLQAVTVSDGSITKEKMATDYVASLSVDGEKITGQGTALNLVPGKGLRLDYDKTTGSLILSQDKSSAGNGDDKGAANGVVWWDEIGNNTTNPVVNYVGTSDMVPLEIRVNGAVGQFSPAGDGRVMQYTPTALSPNLIGGHNANLFAIGVNGATIGGGGTNATPHTIGADFGTIAGGDGNTTVGIAATVGGGNANNGGGNYSTVSGGDANTNMFVLAAGHAFLGGGQINKVTDNHGTLGGGLDNAAGNERSVVPITGVAALAPPAFPIVTDAQYATVGGGWSNTAAGYESFVGGGEDNIAFYARGVTNGGFQNFNIAAASTIGGGEENQIEIMSPAIVRGGPLPFHPPFLNPQYMPNISTYSTISGGLWNQILSSDNSTIGGGRMNSIGIFGMPAMNATISGGTNNTIISPDANIAGGSVNTITAPGSTVGGGTNNNIGGSRSVIAGGSLHTIAAGVTSSAISGGSSNVISASFSAIGGGSINNIVGNFSAIPGGQNLTIGTNSFGFNGDISGTITDLSVAPYNNVALFNDVDVWVGNVSGTARQVRFYSPNVGDYTYTLPTTTYTAFQAGPQPANITYVLPPSLPIAPVGDVLTCTNTGVMSWITPTNGTVTSVGLAMPASVFTVSGSPVTSSGTLTANFTNQAANTIFAGPAAGPAAAPTFRALVAADITAAGGVTGTGTATRVAFWGSTTSLSSNANLFWDNTNNLLGIGTATPTASLHINKTGAVTVSTTTELVSNTVTSATAGISKVGLNITSTGAWTGAGASNTGLSVTVSGATGVLNKAATFTGGVVGVGTTTPQVSMDIDGGIALRPVNFNVTAASTPLPTDALTGTVTDRTIFIINSNSAAVGARVVTFPAGRIDGQLLKIATRNQGGTNNTFRINMNGATNIIGTGNTAANILDMNLHDTVQFFWDANAIAAGTGAWVMFSFANNP